MSHRNQHTDRPTRQKLRVWEAKLAKLVDTAEEAEEKYLMGIYEAEQDGLAQTDIAYMVSRSGKRRLSPSGVKPKATQGAELKRARRGGAVA